MKGENRLGQMSSPAKLLEEINFPASRLGIYKGDTTDEDINLAEKKGLDIVHKVFDEMGADDENETIKLLAAYKQASEAERGIMDYVLVCLCGWTMSSLIQKANDEGLVLDSQDI